MTSWNESTTMQGPTSDLQEHPANYRQLSEHRHGILSSSVERPSVQSWEHECLLAHHQVEDQTMYLVKLRPAWFMPKDIPEEIEAEYWHRYQLNDNIRTLSRPTVASQSLKTARDAKEANSSESRPPEKPIYGSLAEIVNRSNTRSPVLFSTEDEDFNIDDVFGSGGTESDQNNQMTEQAFKRSGKAPKRSSKKHYKSK